MAVVRVERLWDGRGADFDAEGNRTYLVRVRVVTDSVLDSQLAVLFAPGVPRIGVGWYVTSDGVPDYAAVCRRVTPRQDESSGLVWVLDCEFGTRPLTANPGGFGGTPGTGGFQPGAGGAADDPTKKPPVWRLGWETKTAPLRFNLKDQYADPPEYTGGKPVVNSAWDYFDPLPERETGYPVLDYSRVEASPTFERCRKYAFAMNKDAFLGFPPKAVQCLPIELEPEYHGLTQYFRVSYRFRFALGKNPTWNPVLADVGFRKLVAGKWVDIEDPPGVKVTAPQFLNGAGLPMTQAQLAATGPTTAEFFAYPVYDFAPLNIVL